MSLGYVKERRFSQLVRVGKHVLLAGLAAVLVSLYWLVPYALRDAPSVVASFDATHFEAFATSADPQVGVVANVLTLRGFWAEDHAWAEQFAHPDDTPWFFYLGFLGLLFFVVIGLRHLGTRAQDRTIVRAVVVLFVLSTIFAAGVSAMVLWQLNTWLLENVSFWSGFRDTHKWAGVLAVLYALLAGLGFGVVLDRFPRGRRIIAVLALLIPLSLSPYLLFGLGGQVTPVWYPASWQEVDALLAREPDCKAVFLPWHQYYSNAWNDDRLSANPGVSSFACEVVAGHNTELGDLQDIAPHIDKYDSIAAAVTSNKSTPERVAQALDALREAEIAFIIVAHEIEDEDIYRYPFLASPELEERYTSSEISLYRLRSD
jgi:hypothetical protein